MVTENLGSAYCPNCKQPLGAHDTVQELKFKAELAERDHKAALEKLHDELKGARAEVKPPEADAKSILQEELQHYMAGGCPGGNCPTMQLVNSIMAPKFDQLKVEGGKNTLESLLKDKVKLTELAKAGKLELMPDKIIIGLGDRELRR